SRRDESSQSARLDLSQPPSQVPDQLTEDLNYYRGFLEQLLALVRNGDQATVNQMVSTIRSDASHQEILTLLSQASGDNGQVVQEIREQESHNQN
ncbi:hypothetical protein BO71DRAFT_326121, partial [Aspergillus ellipticus CBS 707.79]